MIKEIPNQEDLILYEILRHPVFGWEFIQNVDNLPYEEEFNWSKYQEESLCDFAEYVSLCCGRAVGKTEALSGMLIWLMLNDIFPGEYVVYSVPNKAQLEPVWARVTRLFTQNSILKTFIQAKKGINGSSHTIMLLNGAMLLCRIAGTMGDGRNVIGLHTPFEIVDEAGYYPWPTWLELQSTLNTFTPGFRQIVSGVPTGFRENNVLYYADMQNSTFTKHRIPAHSNPRYTKKDEIRSLELFGQPDEDNYIHFVLGRHGRPTFAVFDRALMNVQSYPVYQVNMNGLKLHNNLSEYFERLSALPLLSKDKTVIMGIDLGYTDPTAIVIMYLNKNGQFKFHARIQLIKVPYPVQTQLIDYLDTKFSPVLIGMDEGHSGASVVQNFHLDSRYTHKGYSKRLIPIQFTSNIVIGWDEEGKEVTQKTRPFSISILQQYSNEHKILYSTTDLALIAELERMVYVKTPAGNKVYRTMTPKGGKKGNDHFTSALLCAMMAWYVENESIKARPKKKLGFVGGWNY